MGHKFLKSVPINVCPGIQYVKYMVICVVVLLPWQLYLHLCCGRAPVTIISSPVLWFCSRDNYIFTCVVVVLPWQLYLHLCCGFAPVTIISSPVFWSCSRDNYVITCPVFVPPAWRSGRRCAVGAWVAGRCGRTQTSPRHRPLSSITRLRPSPSHGKGHRWDMDFTFTWVKAQVRHGLRLHMGKARGEIGTSHSHGQEAAGRSGTSSSHGQGQRWDMDLTFIWVEATCESGTSPSHGQGHMWDINFTFIWVMVIGKSGTSRSHGENIRWLRPRDLPYSCKNMSIF